MRCLTRVVLPEPFWPTMATASPGAIARSMPRRASTPARRSDGARPRTSIDGRRLLADRRPATSARGRRRRPVPRAEPRRPRRRRARRTASSTPSKRVARAARQAARPGATSGRGPAGRAAEDLAARAHARQVAARPPGRRRGRGSARSARGPPARARRTRTPVPSAADAREELGDRPRAGRVELRGRLVEDEERACPCRGCWRSRPAAARRPRARTAGARRGAPMPSVERRRRCGRPSSSRGTPRFSSPKASSSRTVSFEPESWFAGVEKTMPTRARAGRVPSCPAATIPPIATRPPTCARTTRGMKPAAARASVDLPAPFRPATPDHLAGRDGQVEPVRARPRATVVADLEAASSARSALDRGRSARPRSRHAGRRRAPRRSWATADGASQDPEAQPAIDRRVGDDPVRRPPRRRRRTRAPRGRSVRSRTSMSEPSRIGPMSGTQGPDPRAERARDLRGRGPAGPRGCVAGSVLQARHHLDGREDHQGDSVARAARDERLQEVVGQGRLQEQRSRR